MSEHYQGATICVNGHVANYDEPNHQKYCSVCGKETISECQHCHAQSAEDFMMGRYYFDLAIRRICIAINAENHTLGQKL